MNSVIYKYMLGVDDTQVVQMPIGAKILCVGTQGEVLYLWALVDPRMSDWYRRINIAGTGNDLSERIMGDYIGTIHNHMGWAVWHIFDGGEV